MSGQNPEQFKADVEALLQNTGDAIADMFEQLIKGNWVDDHDHDVKCNAAMLNLKSQLMVIARFRHEKLGYSPVQATQ